MFIFLESTTSKEYELCGTTLPEPDRAGPRILRSGDSDPTAYPLLSKEPLRILDLARAEPAEPRANSFLPPLGTVDRAYLDYLSQAPNKNPVATYMPALSFMAVPIVAGERILVTVQVVEVLFRSEGQG